MTNMKVTTQFLLQLVPGQFKVFQEMLPEDRVASRVLFGAGLVYLDEMVLPGGRFTPTDVGLTKEGELVRSRLISGMASELGAYLHDKS